jgi:hypothetical protein
MIRQSAWLHWILAIYLWLMALLPLGHWNLGRGSSLISVMVRGGSPNWTYITLACLATLTATAAGLLISAIVFDCALRIGSRRNLFYGSSWRSMDPLYIWSEPPGHQYLCSLSSNYFLAIVWRSPGTKRHALRDE